MDVKLLKKLGNISQIAGIRESVLRRGRGDGMDILEFYNAAGLRFSVTPDRCMDMFDLSYKGVNLSFQTKNGLVSNLAASPLPQEFADQWPGGMLATCGLDNVGAGSNDSVIYPTHGRISGLPAEQVGVQCEWADNDYILKAWGETHQSRLYGRHLGLKRTIRTTLNSHSLHIHDCLTNYEPTDEPFMLLYHFNFGHPLLSGESLVYTSEADAAPRNSLSADFRHMTEPMDGRGEELYFFTAKTETAWGAIVNPGLNLGAYIRFDTRNLPYFLEWKNMRSHDYTLAIEPCTCKGFGRIKEINEGIAVIGAYSTLDYNLELGVLDGREEIDRFLGMPGASNG